MPKSERTLKPFFSTFSEPWLRCARQITIVGIVLVALMAVSSSVFGSGQKFLEEAVWAEQNANYPLARKLYQQYLSTNPTVLEKQSISVRISVLDEVARFGADSALLTFLDALTYRDKGDFDRSVALLKSINEQHSDSYLNDDALYLIGYISLLDQHKFAQAHEYLRRLLDQYPSTKYLDTALYSEAIALEQLGNSAGAKERFFELRSRHTEFSVGFLNRHWPKSTMLSRYWFDRADKRLNILKARRNDSAKVVERQVVAGNDQTLRVTVDMEGMNISLLLSPSPVTKGTIYKDPTNQAIETSDAKYFAGIVEGDDASWVRVSIRGESIEGVVSTYGTRYVLEPDTLIGTIGYYQPKSRAGADTGSKLHDYVVHPPEADAPDSLVQRVFTDVDSKASASHGVTRLANLAIVVDSQYNDYYGGNGLNRALSVLNIADGIYREDFGLALGISSAVVFTDRATDPMNLGNVTLEQSLRNFRDYRISHAADTPGANLIYLFSGIQNTDEAIGLAWIGGACRVDGYDVGVTTPSVYGDLLVAHELGHSLGAKHDTDTSCAGTTHQLMWPRISASTQQSFSSCSREVLSPNVEFGCYKDVLDLSLEIVAKDILSTDIIVKNNDSQRQANDAVVSIEHTAVDFNSLPGQCFATSSAKIECRTGALGPGGSLTLSFGLEPMVGASMTLLADLAPVGFADVVVNNNTVQIDTRIDTDGNTDITIASIESSGADITSPLGDAGEPSTSGGSAGGSIAWQFLVAGIVSVRYRNCLKTKL